MLLIVGIQHSAWANTQVGVATKFFPKEEHNNGKFACAGRTELLPRDTHSAWEDEDMPICAHRWAPCGTWVRVENLRTNEVSWCLVADRGPYGATTADGDWVLRAPANKDAPKDAKYRAVIDLSPSIARKIGSKGWAKVRIKWWRPKRRTLVMDLWHRYLDWNFVRNWH